MFTTFTYTKGGWAVVENSESDEPRPEGPFFAAAVHDSDLAVITYEPAPPVGGLAYLGFQPRDYFADAFASEDVDLDIQAQGLARWSEIALGNPASQESILSTLARDGVEEPADDFVEETLQWLIRILGLPIPPELDIDVP